MPSCLSHCVRLIMFHWDISVQIAWLCWEGSIQSHRPNQSLASWGLFSCVSQLLKQSITWDQSCTTLTYLTIFSFQGKSQIPLKKVLCKGKTGLFGPFTVPILIYKFHIPYQNRKTGRCNIWNSLADVFHILREYFPSVRIFGDFFSAINYRGQLAVTEFATAKKDILQHDLLRPVRWKNSWITNVQYIWFENWIIMLVKWMHYSTPLRISSQIAFLFRFF